MKPRPDHTRRCPCRNCGAVLPPDRGLCAEHWSRLPARIQERVAKAWALKDFAGWGRAMRDATDSINEAENNEEQSCN